MSLPVPLGVRIYNNFARYAMDVWVTHWLSDLSFRSVIPGGFASATIKLTRPRMLQTPEVITGTATGAGTSATPDYLVASDADAADISIGDRVWIYDSGGSVRFGGQRFKVTGKPSAFGFTNIQFTPAASASTVSGDVMRAARPGHFQYADPVVFDEIANLFNRVQIVDLRSMEIVWEGRVEDPQRDSGTDTWTIGCLGAMVVASDIQRPMFYIDDQLDSWLVDQGNTDLFDPNSDELSKTITSRWINTSWLGGAGGNADFEVVFHERCQECDLYLGRFDITYRGTENISSGTSGNIAAVTDVWNGNFTGQQAGVDVTALSAAETRKANPINGANSFTSSTAQIITIRQGNNGTSGTVETIDGNVSRFVNPRVQVQRVDVNGNALTASTDYPEDYVTVEQVVRDVVGRYLNSRWDTHNANNPHAGQVRATDIYVDTSSTKQITSLTFFDGATAADILAELMKTGDDQYWAIWESNYRATDGAGGTDDSGFRFEWGKWPNGWGYQITSADGLAEQPNGEGVYNFLYYQWRNPSGTLNDSNFYFAQTFWTATTVPEGSALGNAALVRGVTVKREEPTDETTAFNAAASILAGYQKTTNAGSITVKRPIMFHDTGSNSNSGAERMVDPWQIRPGKLARIIDMLVRNKAHEFIHGFGPGLQDAFGRSVANGWGTADSGQDWSTTGGAAADFAVGSGFGSVTHPDTGVARVPFVPAPGADVDIVVDIATSALATGASLHGGPVARFVTNADWYMARVEFTTAAGIVLSLRKRVANVETQLATLTTGLTHTAAAWYRVAFQVQGSALRAKVWGATAAEPAAWQVTAIDSELIFAANVGARGFRNTGNTNANAVVRHDNMQATGLGFAGDPALDGTVFKVVATEYNASDNSCRLELDQVTTWATETQIATTAAPKSTLVVKG